MNSELFTVFTYPCNQMQCFVDLDIALILFFLLLSSFLITQIVVLVRPALHNRKNSVCPCKPYFLESKWDFQRC